MEYNRGDVVLHNSHHDNWVREHRSQDYCRTTCDNALRYCWDPSHAPFSLQDWRCDGSLLQVSLLESLLHPLHQTEEKNEASPPPQEASSTISSGKRNWRSYLQSANVFYSNNRNTSQSNDSYGIENKSPASQLE